MAFIKNIKIMASFDKGFVKLHKWHLARQRKA